MNTLRHCLPLLCLLALSGGLLRAQQPEPPQAPPGPPQQRPQPPPLPPPPPEVLRQDENTISIEATGWGPQGHPTFDKGEQTTNTTASNATFEGRSKFSLGGVLRVPAGKHNTIRITFAEAKANGSFTAATDLNLWNTGYPAGDLIDTNYRMRNIAVSFDYLTWPYPPAARRFRLKTLWQLQVVTAKSGFAAPLDPNSPSSSGSKTLIFPAFGLGVTQYLSENARVEAYGSGFAIPNHSGIADVEGDIAYKLGRIELRGGGKYFYFRTTPQSEFYMRGHLFGAFVGLRFYVTGR